MLRSNLMSVIRFRRTLDKPSNKSSMRKLVVLKLDGNIEQQGFRVTLEIGLEAQRPFLEQAGNLPPNPDLASCLQSHWQQKYRSVEAPTRIKSKSIVYVNSMEQYRRECQQSAERVKADFQQWLESESFRPLDKCLREELRRDEDIRFHLRTEDPSVQKLPWHLWDFFERYPQAELALSSLTQSASVSSTLSKPSLPLRILAILGHSEGIDVEADRRLLENLPQAQTTFLVEPSRRRIDSLLWEEDWDIIFFAGHSATEGEKGRIYLNPTESLTIDELWYALKKAVQKGLKLALFNSCDGLGLAYQLDDLGIPQMIVMRELVPDRVAQAFLKFFLQAFSGGQSFYRAVRQARERLQALEDDFPCASWLPIIYQSPLECPFLWQGVSSVSPKPQPESTASPKIPKMAMLGVGLGVIGAVWLWGLPFLATFLNNYAYRSFQMGDRWQSVRVLSWAVNLDNRNPAAFYNQAWQCEKVRDFRCAYDQYQRAAHLGMAAAYSNLARLYIIQEGDYEAAVTLALEGLKVVDNDRDRYALHKNLGWARWRQGRYTEAHAQLQMALALDDQRAAAYCLRAQVVEAQGNVASALPDWQVCLALAKSEVPDEDRWRGMALDRIMKQKKGGDVPP